MPSDPTRLRLEGQIEQAQRDLDELEVQVAAGEISPETAARLADTYRTELDQARGELADLGAEAPADTEPATPTGRRSRRRSLVTGAILVVAVAVAVATAGQFIQSKNDGPLEGVAAAQTGSLDNVSTETLEATIAGYEADPEVVKQLGPQLLQMRFAAGERRFKAGEFDKAFANYDKIIRADPPAPPDLAAAAYVRVAWIVWQLNGETDLAITLLDRAGQLDPTNAEALYVKGQVLWCGQGKPDQAVPLFEQVLADQSLPADALAQVQDDLDVAKAGGACS